MTKTNSKRPRKVQRPHAGAPEAAEAPTEADVERWEAEERKYAEDDDDDLPSVDLPPGLVAALADAGVKTQEDWDKLGTEPALAAEARPEPYGADAEMDKRVRALLKQEGMTFEEWRAVARKEMVDPRVLQALADRGAALAELGRAVAASELEFTVEAFAARRRGIAARWNAAVAFAKTIYRHCEWCAGRVLYRHRRTAFCSDRCREAAKGADPVRRQRRKERRAKVDE